MREMRQRCGHRSSSPTPSVETLASLHSSDSDDMMEEGTPLRLRHKTSNSWRAVLERRLPVLRWTRSYERTAAVADLVAGITLGLTLVPQSIAYASLADLPVQYGLYSAFIGTMLYVLLGTVKEVSIGPTSLMALLTLQTCRGLPIDYVILLTFLSGCVVLLMGLLRIGVLVELISPSVTSGFTSATAVIISVAQVKGLLGLSFVAESLSENVELILENWHEVRTPDCVLSAVCCTVLLLLRKLKDVKVSDKRHKLKKALWLVSIARNALVVFAASTFAYYTYDPARPLLKLSGRVEPGLPVVSLPPFSTVVGNRTVGFVEMAQELGSAIFMLPVVMVLANIAIAKAFSEGGRVDATQEMVTLGLCNAAGALVRAMPTCGAFTRSAVSHSSGVRTPAAGLYSGIITLLALKFLTQYFFFIPKACLSSVLICAVIFMIDYKIVPQLWENHREELAVAALTFVVGVWRSVELAVLCGALAGLAATHLALRRAPLHLHTLKSRWGDVCRARPTRALLYLNVTRFAERLTLVAAAHRLVLVDCGVLAMLDYAATQVLYTLYTLCTLYTLYLNVTRFAERLTLVAAAHRLLLVDCGVLATLDYAAAQTLARLIKEFEANDQQLIFYNASTDVIKKLEKVEGLDTSALRAHSVAAALALAQRAPAPERAALLHDTPEPHVPHVPPEPHVPHEPLDTSVTNV